MSHYIAIGTNDTVVHLYDAQSRKVRAPYGDIQASVVVGVEPSLVDVGGRDSMIFQPRYSGVLILCQVQEPRAGSVRPQMERRRHVCLASGNDNTVCL
jgi:hypothetical protein